MRKTSFGNVADKKMTHQERELWLGELAKRNCTLVTLHGESRTIVKDCMTCLKNGDMGILFSREQLATVLKEYPDIQVRNDDGFYYCKVV